MKIIQLYNADYEPVGLFDVSETNCPDDQLQKEFERVFAEEDDPEEYLEEEWGIIRVFIEEEIFINV